jgi:hypothetical protein
LCLLLISRDDQRSRVCGAVERRFPEHERRASSLSTVLVSNFFRYKKS